MQRHQRGSSTTGVGATPTSNHAFLLPIPGWAVKKLPLFTPRQALFFNRRPLDLQNDIRHTRVSWGSTLSVPQQPPQLCPDPASTTVGQQRNDACTSTTRNRTSSTAPGCLAVSSSTSPRHLGMACTHQGTSPQQHPQYTSRFLLQDTP
jgi:hypothetical protein